jgi:hypothetical protein
MCIAFPNSSSSKLMPKLHINATKEKEGLVRCTITQNSHTLSNTSRIEMHTSSFGAHSLNNYTQTKNNFTHRKERDEIQQNFINPIRG